LQICFATSNMLRISRAKFWELVIDLAFGTLKILAVSPYKYARVPPQEKKSNTQDAQHASTCLLPPRTLLRPVRRRAPAIRRAGLQNLDLSDPAPGESE
jgi:hypothetical protein